MKELEKIFELEKRNHDLAISSIESYAFQQYRTAIEHLKRMSNVVNLIGTDTVVIVIKESDYKDWESANMSHFKMNVIIK